MRVAGCSGPSVTPTDDYIHYYCCGHTIALQRFLQLPQCGTGTRVVRVTQHFLSCLCDKERSGSWQFDTAQPSFRHVSGEDHLESHIGRQLTGNYLTPQLQGRESCFPTVISRDGGLCRPTVRGHQQRLTSLHRFLGRSPGIPAEENDKPLFKLAGTYHLTSLYYYHAISCSSPTYQPRILRPSRLGPVSAV
jgi:hypothetical protein